MSQNRITLQERTTHIYLSIYLPTYPTILTSMYQCIYQSVNQSISQSINQSINLSIYLCIHLSTYLSIYLYLGRVHRIGASVLVWKQRRFTEVNRFHNLLRNWCREQSSCRQCRPTHLSYYRGRVSVIGWSVQLE